VGTVRLGMISTTARWLTPLLLDELAASHPRVRLVVFEGTTTTLEPAVAGGAIDAAVVNLPTTNRELVARPLFDEDLVLVVAGDNPLARRTSVDFATLSGLALLLPAAGTAYRDELDDAASAAGVTLTARAELDGLRLIASLAWRGYGPAILPASAVAAEGDGYVSLPVSGLPPRRVGAVVRRGRPSAPTRVALELLERLTATAPETATRLGLQPPRPAS
jgi:DNA-binding transcriptional LysR family regulator